MDGSGSITAGDTVTFTLTVSNGGPNSATGVDVADVVPSGYGNVGNISNGGMEAAGTITWNGLNVASGGNLTLTFTATVNVSGNYTNTAQVTASDNFDPDSTPHNDDGDQSEDDEAALTPTVVAVSDLSLTKSVALTTDADGRGSINAGDVVTFTLIVSNAGPSDATGVSVVDVLANGLLSNIGNISSGGMEAGGTVTWSGLNVASGGSVVLTFTATVNASISYINTAQITASDSFDPDSIPNNDDGDQSEDDEAALNLYPWHNRSARMDVDGLDGVAPRDAQLIIGDLRPHGSRGYALSVPRPVSNGFYFPDVDPNNILEAFDALLIIGFLRNPPASILASENLEETAGSDAAAGEGEGELDRPDIAMLPGGQSSANVAVPSFLPLVGAAYLNHRSSDMNICLVGANEHHQRDEFATASSRVAKYDTLDPAAHQPPRRAEIGPNRLPDHYAATRDDRRSLELESVLSDIAVDISEQWNARKN